MIKLKSEKEIEILKEGGQRLAAILRQVAKAVKPGVRTVDLDNLAFELIKKNGDKPAFLNYRPQGSRLAYPASLCVSVNEEIVHGIPSPRVLVEGDVVGLDLGLEHKSLFTDMAITVPVGKIDKETKKLLEVTKEALAIGIKVVKIGGRIGDIGAAVQKYVEKNGLNVVRELAGHGVGFSPHEDPFIPNYGQAGTGEKIKSGMVLAIEPMVTAGSGRTRLERDGFTFSTKEHTTAAHFEQTVAVTERGVIILTK